MKTSRTKSCVTAPAWIGYSWSESNAKRTIFYNKNKLSRFSIYLCSIK